MALHLSVPDYPGMFRQANLPSLGRIGTVLEPPPSDLQVLLRATQCWLVPHVVRGGRLVSEILGFTQGSRNDAAAFWHECERSRDRRCLGRGLRSQHFPIVGARPERVRRYLDLASTHGEEMMSHTAWTSMLAPALYPSRGQQGRRAQRRQSSPLLTQTGKVICNCYPRHIQNSVPTYEGDSRGITHYITLTHPACKTQQTRQGQSFPHDGCSAHGHQTLLGESVLAHTTHTLR